MIHCSRCRSSGFIVATHKVNGGIYSFACSCEIPAKKRISFPVWNASLLKDFIPDGEFGSEMAKPAAFRDVRKLAANDKDEPEEPKKPKFDPDDSPW